MSTYRNTTARLNSNIAEVCTSEIDACRAVAEGLGSHAALQLADSQQLLAAQSSLDQGTMRSLLDTALPNWSSLLPTVSLNALSAGLAGSIPMVDVLRGAVTTDLAVQERRATAGALSTVFSELGGTIERADGEHTTALEVGLGHDTVLVRVGDQGRVEWDYLMLDGACNDLQDEVIDRVRPYIEFDEDVDVQHHDPRGGTLAETAGRYGGRRVDALVADGDEHAGSFTTTLLASANARQQGAVEGVR